MQWGEEASLPLTVKVRAEKQLTRRNAYVSYFSTFSYGADGYGACKYASAAHPALEDSLLRSAT